MPLPLVVLLSVVGGLLGLYLAEQVDRNRLSIMWAIVIVVMWAWAMWELSAGLSGP